MQTRMRRNPRGFTDPLQNTRGEAGEALIQFRRRLRGKSYWTQVIRLESRYTMSCRMAQSLNFNRTIRLLMDTMPIG